MINSFLMGLTIYSVESLMGLPHSEQTNTGKRNEKNSSLSGDLTSDNSNDIEEYR